MWTPNHRRAADRRACVVMHVQRENARNPRHAICRHPLKIGPARTEDRKG